MLDFWEKSEFSRIYETSLQDVEGLVGKSDRAEGDVVTTATASRPSAHRREDVQGLIRVGFCALLRCFLLFPGRCFLITMSVEQRFWTSDCAAKWNRR